MERLQITVNNEKIDYSLEGETNLFDVLNGVRAWLSAEGFVLTAASSDDQELDLLKEDELKGTGIEGIRTLRITAQTALQKAYDDLTAVREFFRILKRAMEAHNAEAVAKVLENYPYIQGGLDPLLDRQGLLSDSLNVSRLDERLAACNLPGSGERSEEAQRQLFAFIDGVVGSIDERLHEMENPNSELAAAASRLRESVERLSEVSVMLQTGRDQEAMQEIVHFAELSSQIIRLYPSLKQAGGIDFASVEVDGTSFPDFYAEFNGILGELIEAFGAEDSVLIGDLLEYEVSPRLEKLKSYIDLLTGA